MSDIIQLLPDHVANQIAAGEVVQRPASVVKELLENAIDANATSIKLIIKEAGKILIQVIDNGCGLSVTDARLCFERHATSKIKKAEDLFNLHTKGFRGEALASIAAVSQVDLKTNQGNNQSGTHIRIEGNKVIYQEPIAYQKGSSISVKNLFYNIPARRNFLKSNSVETRHIINEFQRVALAHPAVAFSFYHNDSEIYVLNSGNLRQRIVSILGKKTNEKLVPIQEKTEVVEIEGFVTKPEFAKKKRDEQFFFVNNRFIKSPYLNHAVQSAFENLIAPGLYPTYFLYLKVPTKSIDINIHPTKTEIKFEDEKTIYAIIRATIKHSLGQYNIAPVLDFNRDASLDTPYTFKNKTTSSPKIEVNPDFNPFKTDVQKTAKFSYKTEKNKQQWESLYTSLSKNENLLEKNDLVDDTLFQNDQTNNQSFQIHHKYIICNIKSGIVYVQQNLAHQRILYEDFLEKITIEGALSQQLLFPLEISFSKSEIKLIKEIKEDLENCGFLFDNILEETIIVKGIPTSITESQISIILEQLLEDIKNDVPNSSFSQLDIMAKSLAKSLSVKTGQYLTKLEQQELIDKLFLCKQPDISPYGKKTFVTIKLDEIDKIFNL